LAFHGNRYYLRKPTIETLDFPLCPPTPPPLHSRGRGGCRNHRSLVSDYFDSIPHLYFDLNSDPKQQPGACRAGMVEIVEAYHHKRMFIKGISSTRENKRNTRRTRLC